jgi:hypothetical protein
VGSGFVQEAQLTPVQGLEFLAERFPLLDDIRALLFLGTEGFFLKVMPARAKARQIVTVLTENRNLFFNSGKVASGVWRT